jgi:aromatic-L-amino-acid decarboxylase
VVSSAGTVNTGAVDPLMAIADTCAREHIWHHVDGAYGGFFFACEHLRPLLRGLDRADSLTLDPHKGLFLPYGTGALLVRDGTALRDVHGGTAGYLPSMPDAAEFYDPSQHGPDLSRGFPGLRVWLCIKLLGAARFKAAIAEKRVMAVDAAEALARVPGIRLVAPPELSLFAFHLTWRGAGVQDENTVTALLLDRVRERGRIMMTGCTVGDRFLARVCILSFRTRRQHVDTCVQHVREETEKIVREHGPHDARPQG